MQVPVFNEAVAALVSGALGINRYSEPPLDLEDIVAPPGVVLSHDCDLLRGNDLVTQGTRFLRLVQGDRLERPDLRASGKLAILGIAVNFMVPRRFYFGNCLGMLDLERQYGYRSVWYILLGRGGRVGARSGSSEAARLIRQLPREVEIGLHYNYDTHLNADAFEMQKAKLKELGVNEIQSGRAHYLRFDARSSWKFLERQGIQFDESVGWYDCSGYRAGIAGVFNPWNFEEGRAFNILELPLVFMDVHIANPPTEEQRFDKMYAHLHKIGGLISVLFHPGKYYNPEYPHMTGVYESVLSSCFRNGGKSWLPRDLLTIPG